MVKSVAVYLGSSEGSEKFMEFAFNMGRSLAMKGIEVVYGGADVGTMKALADGALSAGGTITGVFPDGFGGKREVALSHRDIARRDLTRLISVKDFDERRKVMRELSDCCLVLPGSFGTMDELFCYAVENEIGVHDKISYVMNLDCYYDGLEAQIATMKREGFVSPLSGVIRFVRSSDEFFAALGE